MRFGSTNQTLPTMLTKLRAINSELLISILCIDSEFSVPLIKRTILKAGLILSHAIRTPTIPLRDLTDEIVADLFRGYDELWIDVKNGSDLSKVSPLQRSGSTFDLSVDVPPPAFIAGVLDVQPLLVISDCGVRNVTILEVDDDAHPTLRELLNMLQVHWNLTD